MADKKQNGPIVIKVFLTCTGEAKWAIVSTVYHHRSQRMGCPFRNPMKISFRVATPEKWVTF